MSMFLFLRFFSSEKNRKRFRLNKKISFEKQTKEKNVSLLLNAIPFFLSFTPLPFRFPFPLTRIDRSSSSPTIID